MYTNVSARYKELMTSNRGELSARLEFILDDGLETIVGLVEADDIVSIDYAAASSQDHVRIGSFVLPTMTAKIKASAEGIEDFNKVFRGAQMIWTVLLKDNTMQQAEGAPVCALTVSRVLPTKDGENLTITAESRLVGKIDTPYPQTLTMPVGCHAILDDIASKLGVTVDKTRVGEFIINSLPASVTYRQMLCGIAEYTGLFVAIDRMDSTISFIWYGTALQNNAVIGLSKDCCDDIELTTENENYNGLVCQTASTVVSSGTAPFLSLENCLRLFDADPGRVSTLVQRNDIGIVKVRTGRVSLALGNILYDVWDMISIPPDEQRHNLLDCDLQSTTVSGVAVTRNDDGSYNLSGVAAESISLVLQTNDLPHGRYIMKRSIVDPSEDADNIQWIVHGTIVHETDEVTYPIYYDTVFTVPDEDPVIVCDHYKIELIIDSGASFNNVTLYPMIQAADDTYTEYEQYIPDMTVPVCQLDHHYDGGLRTVITIPEIKQNDDATVQYSESQSETAADLSALSAQLASAVTSLTAQLATKADSATVGAQIADLDDRVTALEQGGGGSRSQVSVGTAVRSAVDDNVTEVVQ